MNTGQRLEHIRAQIGLTQSETCARMGIPLRTYTRYATGERPPSADALAALAHMGVNLNWLITGDGSPWLTSSSSAPKELRCPLEGGGAAGSESCPANLSEKLVAVMAETITRIYAECSTPLSAGTLGSAIARMHNEIATANLESWEEKIGAVRLASAMLRRQLLTADSHLEEGS